MLMTDMAEFIGRNVRQVLDKATQRFPGRHVMLLGMRSAGCPEHDTDVRPVAAGARERRGCPRCSTRRTLPLALIRCGACPTEPVFNETTYENDPPPDGCTFDSAAPRSLRVRGWLPALAALGVSLLCTRQLRLSV